MDRIGSDFFDFVFYLYQDISVFLGISMNADEPTLIIMDKHGKVIRENPK